MPSFTTTTAGMGVVGASSLDASGANAEAEAEAEVDAPADSSVRRFSPPSPPPSRSGVTVTVDDRARTPSRAFERRVADADSKRRVNADASRVVPRCRRAFARAFVDAR
jgi:hypothetical protein